MIRSRESREKPKSQDLVSHFKLPYFPTYIPTELSRLRNREMTLFSQQKFFLCNVLDISVKDSFLSENSFSGTIPTYLGHLIDLEELVFWRNELSGTIPSKLINLTL